jgi:hypothetical protein
MRTDRRARRAIPAAALALCGLAAAADRPWRLSVEQALAEHSNLLRLADGASAGAGQSRDDRVALSTLDARGALELGRQRLRSELVLREHRHALNEPLDHASHDGLLAFDAATAGGLRGQLLARSRRALAPLDLVEAGTPAERLVERNLENERDLRLRVELGAEAPLMLSGSLAWQRLHYTLPTRAVQSRAWQQQQGLLALRWAPQAGAAATLSWRQDERRYPWFRQLADGRFEADRLRTDRIDAELLIDDRARGRFELLVGHARTRHQADTGRDFSGPGGRLRWSSAELGKLRLGGLLQHEQGQDSVLAADEGAQTAAAESGIDRTRITRTLQGALAYQAAAKLLFDLSVTVRERELARESATLGRQTGTERSVLATLGWQWQPRRAVRAGCTLGAERRRGEGAAASSLRAGQAGCSLRWQLD